MLLTPNILTEDRKCEACDGTGKRKDAADPACVRILPECYVCNNSGTIPAQKSDPTLMANTGLLSPKGVLYPCRYGGHSSLTIRLIGYDSVGDYTKYNFLHLEEMYWGVPYIQEPTQDQIDTIFDWCQKHAVSMPHWLEQRLAKKSA